MQEPNPSSTQETLQQEASPAPPQPSGEHLANGTKGVTCDQVSTNEKITHSAEELKATTRDGGLCLELIVAMNGQNLTRAVASLTKRQGKRPVYTESTLEGLSKVAKEFLNDPKGAIRLRSILGLGLQQGAKRPSIDTFWAELLHLIESFLREIGFPRSIAIEEGIATIDPISYRDLWHNITLKNDKNSTKGTKELLAAQEVMLLDVMFAYWKDRLSSDSILQAISYLEISGEIKDPFHRSLPWSAATSLATNLPASIIIAQANAVHSDLERLQRAHREATQQAAKLESQLAATNQELEQTQAALDEESSLLRTAKQNIEKLERDVMAAGAIHRHRADELRSRYKGLLEGELDRHLVTIQRAADMTPPRGSVIIERVEILLETLKRELIWLENLE
jgi:hypothetical protein